MSEQVAFEPRPEIAGKRCCTCRQVKPLLAFSRNAGSKDGRHNRCRECDHRAHGSPEKRLHIRDACAECSPAVKFCPTCKQHLPVAAFSVCSRAKDGLASECRECDYKDARERLGRKRAYHLPTRCNECLAGAKRCSRCKAHKARDQFTVDTSTADGLSAYCAVCNRLRNNNNVLRRYGITQDDYDRMIAAQGGGCAICGSEDGKTRLRYGSCQRRLHVDHDHKTGKVRGVLCGPCNAAIGMLEENVDRIHRAAEYVASHRRSLP